MNRLMYSGLLLAWTACGRSSPVERSTEGAEESTGGSSGRVGNAAPAVGLVGAGTLMGAEVLLGIIDEPPRVLLHTASGDRSWSAPARIGALAGGARPGEVVVAAAWPEARVPRAEVWSLVDGVPQRHCVWTAPPLERWRSQPRGASSVLALSDGAVVAGVDGSLVRFDTACSATVLHAEGCCEGERPLRLRGDAGAWFAVDVHGHRVYPAGDLASGCAPIVDGASVRGGGWSTPLPPGLTDVSLLDWSASCEVVLLAAGTGAWTCRAAGCTRVR